MKNIWSSKGAMWLIVSGLFITSVGAFTAWIPNGIGSSFVLLGLFIGFAKAYESDIKSLQTEVITKERFTDIHILDAGEGLDLNETKMDL